MLLRNIDWDNLRAIAGMLKPQVTSLPLSALPDGVPRGALTEFSGPAGGGKTELILRFISENPSHRIAWIEDDFSAYPCAFERWGIPFDRVLFCPAKQQALWTAHQILRSQLFGIVVLATREISEIDLRRLQLSAEKSRACLIRLAETPTVRGSWPIALQVQVGRESRDKTSFQLELLKGSSSPLRAGVV